MKKRELKYQIAQLRERIEALESRPQPKQCEECGILFVEKRPPVMTWTSGSFGVAPFLLPSPETRVVDGATIRITYVQTRELCPRCFAALQESKSA